MEFLYDIKDRIQSIMPNNMMSKRLSPNMPNTITESMTSHRRREHQNDTTPVEVLENGDVVLNNGAVLNGEVVANAAAVANSVNMPKKSLANGNVVLSNNNVVRPNIDNSVPSLPVNVVNKGDVMLSNGNVVAKNNVRNIAMNNIAMNNAVMNNAAMNNAAMNNAAMNNAAMNNAILNNAAMNNAAITDNVTRNNIIKNAVLNENVARNTMMDNTSEMVNMPVNLEPPMANSYHSLNNAQMNTAASQSCPIAMPGKPNEYCTPAPFIGAGPYQLVVSAYGQPTVSSN